MKRVYIYCEGQTEESFINEILSPYFITKNIEVYPIVCTTKRTSSSKYKGGVCNYSKIKNELLMLSKSHTNEYITTMFDYYAMPKDTPGIDSKEADIYIRIRGIESDINTDIGQPNCKFHFMVHEFEGILFSNPRTFSMFYDEKVVRSIQRKRNNYPTPEHINNSFETAPSKRIKELIPNYGKVRNGVELSKSMGIGVIMDQCPHFKEWVNMISNY